MNGACQLTLLMRYEKNKEKKRPPSQHRRRRFFLFLCVCVYLYGRSPTFSVAFFFLLLRRLRMVPVGEFSSFFVSLACTKLHVFFVLSFLAGSKTNDMSET